MKHLPNNHSERDSTGNYSRFIALLLLSLVSLGLSSCSVIAEIFKAGMGFGIFAVLAVIVVIVFIFMRFRKK